MVSILLSLLISTTSGATNDDKVGIMTTLDFQKKVQSLWKNMLLDRQIIPRYIVSSCHLKLSLNFSMVTLQLLVI